MFENFWKYLNSFYCVRKTMICPYCGELEWRLNKSEREFELYGCMRCRLITCAKSESTRQIAKKYINYRVSGRYE